MNYFSLGHCRKSFLQCYYVVNKKFPHMKASLFINCRKYNNKRFLNRIMRQPATYIYDKTLKVIVLKSSHPFVYNSPIEPEQIL